MFTGIITETGELADIRRKSESLELRISGPETAADAGLGDSVAVDGVCLTVTHLDGRFMTMDVGEETYRRTTLSGRRAGDAVNLEPALRVGDRLGGHIVSGHVDAVGSIVSFDKRTTEVAISIRFPSELGIYLAEKGSVTVDGISLTVGRVSGEIFELHVIPHTLDNTTLKDKKPGAPVNLEADVLSRYVVNAMQKSGAVKGGGLVDKMIEFGYIRAADNA